MALFDGTTDQFRTIVPGIAVNFTLADARPELAATELSLLPRFLGDAVADQLSALADAPESTGPTARYLTRALYLARVAVGRIGFANYLPFAEVQIGDDGVTITSSEGRKAAFEYQTRKVQKRLLEEGWRSLDELITLVANQPSLFPEWPNSPYYAEHQKAFFKTAADFSKFYPIQDRWLTFWALRPFIQAVEETRGEDAKARIGALPVSVTTTQKERLTRELLRALAYQSVMDALPHLSVELNGANVQVNYASQFGNTEYYEPPGKDHLSWVMENLQKQLNLAWSSFESGITNVESPTSTNSSTDTGVIAGGGAVTML